MNKYDAVVIGAGNGGLVAAIRLLQSGAKVLLVERHNLPGGFATSFRRGRFEFEASLHELNDFGKDGGDVRDLFDSLGVTNKIEWTSIPEAYHVICPNEKLDATMPFGIKAFIDKMEEYVPGSRKSMERFFALASEIREAQAYTNAQNGLVDSSYMVKHFGNYVRTGSYSVKEVLETLKMPKKAQDILSAYWCYLGAKLSDMSFTHYASMVIRYIDRGVMMPKGRSHEISLAMADRIYELGGEIWFNTGAKKILTDKEGAVCGVLLDDGRTIETKHVVADIEPTVVYGRMMDNVPEKIVKATNARKLAGRGFSIFLGLNKSPDELGIESHNYFLYDTSDSDKQYELMKGLDNAAQATVCLNRAYPDCSPKGTTIMYFTTLYMDDAWGKVKPEDYYKTKEDVARRLIERFEEYTGAHLMGNIEQISIATPMTYARYGGHPEGGIYGYESKYDDGLTARLLMMKDDKMTKGLRFCGGSAMRLSGYSSAYFSGDISGRQTAGDIKRGE